MSFHENFFSDRYVVQNEGNQGKAYEICTLFFKQGTRCSPALHYSRTGEPIATKNLWITSTILRHAYQRPHTAGLFITFWAPYHVCVSNLRLVHNVHILTALYNIRLLFPTSIFSWKDRATQRDKSWMCVIRVLLLETQGSVGRKIKSTETKNGGKVICWRKGSRGEINGMVDGLKGGNVI